MSRAPSCDAGDEERTPDAHSQARPDSVTEPNVSIRPEARQDIARDLIIERYRFILQQINATNENVYRFLAIYQGLMTTLVGAQILVTLNARHWRLTPSTASASLYGLLALETLIGCFAVMLIAIGTFAWIDYRSEECDLTDDFVGIGFRTRPNRRNMLRWYETYIVIFIALTTFAIWAVGITWMLPAVRKT